jgi:hypothetical protein
MATTSSDVQDWLDKLNDNDIEEIYCLYESIVGVTEMGGFKCSQNNGKLFIQNGDIKQTLMLESGKAIKEFLDKLDNEYGGDFGWVGGHYEFVRSMRKDD